MVPEPVRVSTRRAGHSRIKPSFTPAGNSTGSGRERRYNTTVPAAGMLNGDFSALCTSGFTNGVCNPAVVNGVQTFPGRIYDPYTVKSPGGGSLMGWTPAIQPAQEIAFRAESSARQQRYWRISSIRLLHEPGTVNNFSSAAASGGNTNEFVVRGTRTSGSNTRLFGRFAYFGLTDLPNESIGDRSLPGSLRGALPQQAACLRCEPHVYADDHSRCEPVWKPFVYAPGADSFRL